MPKLITHGRNISIHYMLQSVQLVETPEQNLFTAPGAMAARFPILPSGSQNNAWDINACAQ